MDNSAGKPIVQSEVKRGLCTHMHKM